MVQEILDKKNLLNNGLKIYSGLPEDIKQSDIEFKTKCQKYSKEAITL